MRTALMMLLAFGGTAHAQTIECPQRYAGAPLIGGGMFDGPAHEYELVGEFKKEHGGHLVTHRFPGAEVKWLSCVYGKEGAVQWRQISTTAQRCEVRTRQARGQVRVTADCK